MVRISSTNHGGISRYLDLVLDAGRVHTGGLVHRITPHVKHGLSCSDDPTHYGTARNTHAQSEIVEGVRVEVIKHPLHGDGKVHERAQRLVCGLAQAFVVLWTGAGVEAGCGHVRRTNRLDLMQTSKIWVIYSLLIVTKS